MVIMNIDHYIVLGLPSGEEGAKLSQKEIKKAYRLKAIELHPDKRPDNPDEAHADFIKLQDSFKVLKEEQSRKKFDDALRVRRDKIASRKLEKKSRFQQEEEILGARSAARKRKLWEDRPVFERRERSTFASDGCFSLRAQLDAEKICRKLREEMASDPSGSFFL